MSENQTVEKSVKKHTAKQMIIRAVKALQIDKKHNKKGVSRISAFKYIASHYQLDLKKDSKRLNKANQQLIKEGLLRSNNKGHSLFLDTEAIPEKKKKDKTAKKPKAEKAEKPAKEKKVSEPKAPAKVATKKESVKKITKKEKQTKPVNEA